MLIFNINIIISKIIDISYFHILVILFLISIYLFISFFCMPFLAHFIYFYLIYLIDFNFINLIDDLLLYK
jgi:hypothetical protein